MSELPSNEADAIKADIEQARAELATTTDALTTKFDVRAQARTKAQTAGARVSSVYQSARTYVPDKRWTALIVVGVVVTTLVVRRVTR